jgi:hypothetical protein
MLSKSESHTPKVAASVGTLQLLRRGVQRKGLGFDMHPHASSGVTDQAHVDRVLGSSRWQTRTLHHLHGCKHLFGI